MKKTRILLLVAALSALLFSHVAMASEPDTAPTRNIPTYDVNLSAARKVSRTKSTVTGYKCYDVTAQGMNTPFIVENKCALFARYDQDGQYEVCSMNLDRGKLEAYPLLNETSTVKCVVGDGDSMYWVEYDDFARGWCIVGKRAGGEAYAIRRKSGDDAINMPEVTLDGKYLVWMETIQADGEEYKEQNRILVMDRGTGKISELTTRERMWNNEKIAIENGIVAFTDMIDDQWVIRCFDVSRGVETQRFRFGKNLPEYVSFDGKQLAFTILRGVQPTMGTMYVFDDNSKKLTTVLGGAQNSGHSMDAGNVLCFNESKAGKPILYCAGRGGAFSLPKVKYQKNPLTLSYGTIDGGQVAMVAEGKQSTEKKDGKKIKNYLVVFALSDNGVYAK